MNKNQRWRFCQLQNRNWFYSLKFIVNYEKIIVHRMKQNVYRRNHKAMAQIVLVGRDSDTKSRPTEAYKLDFCIACSRKDNLKNLKLFWLHSMSFILSFKLAAPICFYLYGMDMNQRKLHFLYSMNCCSQYLIHILERIHIIQNHNLLHILVQGLYHLIKHVYLVTRSWWASMELDNRYHTVLFIQHLVGAINF